MGLIGIVLAFIMLISKLSSVQTLGTDYLTPFSPLNITALKNSIIRKNRKHLKERPTYLTKNIKRMGDYNEKNTN